MSKTQERPAIEVVQDYDDYFAGMVASWVAEKVAAGEPFKSKVIRITSGPWRAYAVAFSRKDDTLTLDFYSALRTGFGSLSSEDVEGIKAVL